nr:mechanosensitive ion channel domain-containing protein [Halovenus carboxidivorans]
MLVALLCGAAAGLIENAELAAGLGEAMSIAVETIIVQGLLVAAVVLGVLGAYTLVLDFLLDRTTDKRRQHNLRNITRFVFSIVGIIGMFGVLTQQYLGLFFSLGIVGFAVTFALQQPLFSLIGWLYIMIKQPYSVGDRVEIDDSKGDVVEVDFLVTTLWEIGGDLVSSNQPSGRVITLPNSVVLSSHVHNYSYREFPHVWNELSIQVAYETDLQFAEQVMIEEADDYLGDEMEQAIEQYRKNLAQTPVELEVRERPTVNVTQKESWVELRLRYLVHPRRGQRVRNELYERILARMNEHPQRVAFPVSRNR